VWVWLAWIWEEWVYFLHCFEQKTTEERGWADWGSGVDERFAR
jgi:hypothetical protein